ncbi:MAG: hypothetical protein WBN96_08590 [Gammaproteobacteria bacterium]
MFWSQGNVRFEYLEDGVPMVQIVDKTKSKIIWLDTENKIFIERELENAHPPELTVKSKQLDKNPCAVFVGAECTRLKEVVINERNAVKWLITLNVQGEDRHVFQWLDKKLNIPLRQQNPDGSMLDVVVQENLEMNGRKVRKHEIYAVGPDGVRNHSIQWHDAELEIVLRQQNDDGTMDELRNIKVEQIGNDKFSIPKDYKQFDASKLTPRPEAIANKNQLTD